MTIRIAHLYYDLLNLYGESGNIKVLKKTLEDYGVKVIVDLLTKGDNIDFSKYDLIYLGMGTEENQLIVLNDFIKYKELVQEYIENNGFFVATGNSIELFGKTLTDGKNVYECLNVFDYNAEVEEFRMIDESIFKCNFINDYIIGFQNQNGVIRDIKNEMFDVVSGVGSYPNSKREGIHYKNFYGTYLIGPLFVRNPQFTEYFVKSLINNKDKKYKIKKINNKVDYMAYKTYMNLYHDELNKIGD